MTTKNLISSESLKRVIIRFDYSGVSPLSLSSWLEKIKGEKLSFFGVYNEAECGQMSLDMSHLESVSMDTGIEIKEMTKGPLHIFQQGALEGLRDKLKLEISHYYMALSVNCIDYQSSEPYRNLMGDLMHSLFEHDKFARLNRLGIRKLDFFDFGSKEELLLNLSPKAMNLDLQCDGNGFLGRDFSDQYIVDDENGIIMLYGRNLKCVDDGNTNLRFQAIIDMDCFVQNNNMMRPDKSELLLISSEINKSLYYFFENSLTDYYIMNHLK